MTLVPLASGAARSTRKPHTWRIVETAGAGGNARPASARVSVCATCPTRRSRDPRRSSQRAYATGLDLLVGDLAVRVGVEVEACLEGRDLGLVDDDIEQDPVRLDAHARVVVDREVAERVGERDGGHEDGRDRRGQRGAENGSVERQATASTSHRGVGTHSGRERMKVSAARLTRSRSARRCRLHSGRDSSRDTGPPRLVHHHRRPGWGRQDDTGGATCRASQAAGHDVHLTREPGGTARRGAPARSCCWRTASTSRPADQRPPLQRRPPPARQRGHRPGARGQADDRVRSIRGLDAGVPGLARASRSRDLRVLRIDRDGWPRPDVTIPLLACRSRPASRARRRATDRFEAEFDLDFHRRVRDGFPRPGGRRAGPIRGRGRVEAGRLTSLPRPRCR